MLICKGILHVLDSVGADRFDVRAPKYTLKNIKYEELIVKIIKKKC